MASSRKPSGPGVWSPHNATLDELALGNTGVMSVDTVVLQDATLTRVGYIDVAIDPAAAGLLAEDFADIDWREPLWTEGDQLRAGAAVWFADIDGQRLAFDPVQAADPVLRSDPDTERSQQTAIAELLVVSGFDRASVDVLVMTHIEGVGMCAWHNDDGSWSPFFPNANVIVSVPALESFLARERVGDLDIEYDAWHALIDQGVVSTYVDGDSVVDGVRAQVTGAHCAGHAILHFGTDANAPEATMLGHLAISPVHLATGECPLQHPDPATAWSALSAAAEDGRILIGPLWPAPGGGRWMNNEFIATPGA